MALRFEKLTRLAMRALNAGQKITEHGITAHRLVNGDMTFSIGVMVDGTRIHRVVGRESAGNNREQAERAIETLRTHAREGRLSLPKNRKTHRSFKEAATEYLVLMEKAGGKDLANKRRHLTMHLVPNFGNSRLDKLSTFELRLYRKKRQDAGAKDATINREMATLQHMLNRAASKEWGWIKGDDLPEIPKARERRKKLSVLNDQQRQDLLDGAIADQDDRAWLFVLFGLTSAMRHSEIVERRYDEIDFNHCRIWINKAKAGEREQPITPALRDALLRQRDMEEEGARDGWIFPAVRSGTKRPHRRDMRAAFARASIRAGLDPKLCTPHTMRHTAITSLAIQGVDVATIQKISGHKTTAMVMHYVHIFGQHIDDAISGLSIAAPDTITRGLHTDPQGGKSTN